MGNKTLVDTCVLLDIFGDDPAWGEWSHEQVKQAHTEGGLVINPMIYTETSLNFKDIEILDTALSPKTYKREDLPWKACFLAGRAFKKYRRRGGTKSAPMPDHYIGAHAAVEGYRLLTRNPRDFRSYFPDVEIISP